MKKNKIFISESGRKYTIVEKTDSRFPIAGAWGFVFDENNKMFYTSCDGKADLPGGCLDKNESPKDAFIREIMEEIGVKISPEKIKYLMTIKYEDLEGETWNLIYYYAIAEEVLDKWEQVEDEDEERGICDLEEFKKLKKRKYMGFLDKLIEKLPSKFKGK